ncbi:hypothetical protein PR202_ga27334 [Eleusine coracana subsp. coracana]|uniref:Bifunctional inhibitor/plant lipid transfer protein/seed storage helical domain-containing protein n=1 Tax=Eleusine coracana subsp. coracana TaxID=191504 RepID=A0AAV5DG83_ELECO|nr:hypothetical protein PR202_ga27334 [Eleusine coracana subsp. coracana]
MVVVMLTASIVLLAACGASAAAAACNAKLLKACVPALTTGVTPTGECCSNVKAQQSCLCQFAKNPAYARYVGSPNTRRTIAACGVAPLHCS